MSTVTKIIWTENHHPQFPRFLWHPDFPPQSSKQMVFALRWKHHLTVEKMYWWEFTKSLKLVFFVFPFFTIYSHFVVSSMFKTNIFEGQVRVWGPKFYLILVCGSERSQSSHLRCFKRGLRDPLCWWHLSPFFVLVASDLLQDYRRHLDRRQLSWDPRNGKLGRYHISRWRLLKNTT